MHSMTIEVACTLLSQWDEMSAANYAAFCNLSLLEKRRLVTRLDLANKAMRKSEKHWAEKAIVWELWQELRLKYAASHEGESR